MRIERQRTTILNFVLPDAQGNKTVILKTWNAVIQNLKLNSLVCKISMTFA